MKKIVVAFCAVFLLVLIGLLIHFLSIYNEYHEEQEAAKILSQEYGDEFLTLREYVGPSWIDQWGIAPLQEPFHRIVTLTIEGFDGDIDLIAKFKYLTDLNLQRSSIDDKELSSLLQQLPAIRDLNLSDTRCTGVGLDSAPSKLEFLSMNGTPLGDSGMKVIGNLKSLDQLSVVGCKQVTSRGIQHLTNTRVSFLHLASCNLDDTVIPVLCSIKSIKYLDLNYNPITGEGFKNGDSETKLSDLYMAYTRLTDAQIEFLLKLKSLETLDLRGTAISYASLKKLVSLPSLQTLNIGDTSIGDDAVQGILALKSLTILTIGESQFSENAIREIKQGRPELRVYVDPSMAPKVLQ